MAGANTRGVQTSRGRCFIDILVLSGDFPPATGGIAVFAANVCRELVHAGHSIDVLARTVPGGCPSDARVPYRIYRYPARDRLASLPAIMQTLARAARHRYDLVLLTSFLSTHALGVLLLRQLRRWPFAIFVHGFDLTAGTVFSRVDRIVSRKVLDKASLVIANSAYLRDRVIKLGVEASRAVVVHPGVDVERFRPGLDASDVAARYELKGKRVVLTVARLIAMKGHDNVLRALPAVLERVPDLTYLVVGDGEHMDHLRKLAADLNVSRHVVFAGKLEHDELPALYACADVFVMPTRERETWGGFETFGISFLEASACGKPVIAGNRGGIPEAVLDGQTGLLVDPTDVGQISRALLAILTDDELARTLGTSGRMWVERELTWDRMGVKLDGQLRRIAVEGRRSDSANVR